MSIEDIVLDKDRRGISALRPYLPPDFCSEAARLVLDNHGTAMIVTGFYILAAGATETDGPPGALLLGDALQSLGYSVVYVTDRFTWPLLSALAASRARVLDFPIADDDRSREVAAALLETVRPSLLIAIERCGRSSDGRYRNMRNIDISEYVAKTDFLFDPSVPSVGIGDGGNEIGMGLLADEVSKVPSLVEHPCVTATTRLVISSVSNWGGLGLVAALSQLTGQSLLPTIADEQALVRELVDLGAVDGITLQREYSVDGFALEEQSEALAALRRLVGEAP